MIERLLQKMSIRFRIAVLIFSILFVGLLGLSNFLGKGLQYDFKIVLGEQQLSATNLVALHINEELIRRTRALQKMTQSVTPSLALDQKQMAHFIRQQKLIDVLFDGGIYLCELSKNANAPVSLAAPNCKNFLKNASLVSNLKNGRPSIGELAWESDHQQTAFLTAVPVRDEYDQIRYGLIGVNRLNEDNILGMLPEHSYGHVGDYLVISQDQRTVISATNTDHLFKNIDTLNARIFSKKNRDGDKGRSLFDTFENVASILSIQQVDVSGWSVISVLPVNQVFVPIGNLSQFLHVGVLIITFIVIFAVWVTLRSQLSPLITTVKEIDDIAHNRKPFAFLPVKSQDEVGRLIGSFNQLLKKLDDREVKLYESEIFSHAILNSVPVEIAVLDQDGTIIMVNKPWLSFSEKYSNEREVNEEVNSVGVSYLDVCRQSMVADPKCNAGLVLDGISAVLESRLPSFSLEYKCEAPTQVYWFSLVVTPLNHHNSGAVVSHTDITQRKQIEQALHIAWASAQAALDAIFWLDKEAKIVDVNLAASKLLGYDEADLLQLYLADISPENFFDREKWDQYFLNLKRDGAIKKETKLRGRCGKTVEVEVNATYIQHEDKELICAFTRDITDRKRQEVALRNAKAEAEKANNAKSKFLAATSHDLRQPLSALALYVDLLSQYRQPRIKGVVNSIQGCVESMSELLTDLLDISKLEAGVVQPNNAYFFVDELLQKLVNIFSAESNVKKLTLHYRASNLVANSDQKLFFRIIGNLISNAIRYTESGGILIACRPHEGKYYVEVYDTGIGIPQHQMELIFEEFRQLGDDSRHRGSGLGLAIVKKMTSLMGLQLIVNSRVGHGSVFRVEIPVVVDAFLFRNFSLEPSLENVLIAVVDDNVEILNALRLTLQGVGYQVIVGTSGETILENLHAKTPDLIVSDFRLQKGENGFDVIDALRQRFGQDLPAILMTGDTDPTIIRAMQESGISVLFKPLQFKKLKELITTILQNGKL